MIYFLACFRIAVTIIRRWGDFCKCCFCLRKEEEQGKIKNEKGESNPTINTLWKIAGGLQVSYTKLIDEQIDAPLLIRKEESVIAEYDGYRAYHYNTANPARDFEFFNGELDAHKEYTSEGHGMNTHEYLLVTRGEMVLRYGGEEYLLREGDFIHFDCTQPHTYCNRGESMTEFTNIVYYIG